MSLLRQMGNWAVDTYNPWGVLLPCVQCPRLYPLDIPYWALSQSFTMVFQINATDIIENFEKLLLFCKGNFY